ncbi:hypothetical protein HHI36_018314 [Cryptolaemus montrouzieri]|uniref:Uncharacterized protein n=1 Tax=Cryptolaemus montrouzieri TaxID=559131 RepID=A0ABD2NZM2_9CUCU
MCKVWHTFHPSYAARPGYGRYNAVMCWDAEVLKSGRRASASVSLSDTDVELIVAELSKVFQLQFDKFKNEMHTECFENITALTNKIAEFSLQHDKHVSELSSLKTEVMELRMENVALRNSMDEAAQGLVNKFDGVLKVSRLCPVANKPRSRKIITSSPEVVADVLRECRKPENTNHRLYSDCTNLQREYMARMEQELAGKMEQGERVVMRFVYGQPRIVSRKN